MTDDHRHPPVMFFALLLCWSHVFCEKMAIQEQQKGPTSVRPFYVFGWYEVRNAGCRSSVTNSDTASIHARGSQDIFTQGNLAGGFKHSLFSPLVGEDFHFFLYFSYGLKPPARNPLDCHDFGSSKGGFADQKKHIRCIFLTWMDLLFRWTCTDPEPMGWKSPWKKPTILVGICLVIFVQEIQVGAIHTWKQD